VEIDDHRRTGRHNDRGSVKGHFGCGKFDRNGLPWPAGSCRIRSVAITTTGTGTPGNAGEGQYHQDNEKNRIAESHSCDLGIVLGNKHMYRDTPAGDARIGGANPLRLLFSGVLPGNPVLNPL
jgi:hypothetical protein